MASLLQKGHQLSDRFIGHMLARNIRIEQDLIKLFPRDSWTLLSHWLIFHGRRRCAARKPDCPNCELRDICPSSQEKAAD